MTAHEYICDVCARRTVLRLPDTESPPLYLDGFHTPLGRDSCSDCVCYGTQRRIPANLNPED